MRTQIPGKQILDEGVDTADLKDAAVTDEKLSPTGVAGGTYTQVTVNEQGRVIEGANPTTLDGYGILDAISSTEASAFPIVLHTAAPGFAGARVLSGTAGEITITNTGADSIVAALAANPILPGTGAVTLPAGTTAQRPAGSSGMLRYNTTNSALEFFDGNWEQAVASSDKRLLTANVLKVSKDPGPGEFSSIKTAIDSITTNSETNQFIVMVSPGTYDEDPITMKPYVSVRGKSHVTTTIRANDPNSNLIIGVNDGEIEGFMLTGVTGPDVAAIHFSSATNHELKVFKAENIRFGHNTICARTTSGWRPAFATAARTATSTCSGGPGTS